MFYYHEKFLQAQVKVHIISTGAGVGIQNYFWENPGSSNYLSGASFPYSAQEQTELLGFTPDSFCSEENAIDLACSAYMKAYQFQGKKAVGLGLTASVASETIHKGDHRVHACVITNDKVLTTKLTFKKGVGKSQRLQDGRACDDLGFYLILHAIWDDKSKDKLPKFTQAEPDHAEEKAFNQFMKHPYFTSTGLRPSNLDLTDDVALMPGAFNPPHEGHFGSAQHVLKEQNHRTIFEISTDPPHKNKLTIQDMLQRAKLLQYHDRLFTANCPLYIDKSKTYPDHPLVVGADAMLRMLDPKWGVNPYDLLQQFKSNRTKIFLIGRIVDGLFVSPYDILKLLDKENLPFKDLFYPIDGSWNISSTEIRKQCIK